ncbi:MAG: FhaA domain-containing protein [Actinomycetota bacterium]
MPILRDFERRLGGLVEGLFSKAFRSGVQPVEIAKLIMREMEAGRSVGVSEVWAPNRFELSLSPEDAARYDQAEEAIVSELRRVIRESAAEHGWGLLGPPDVEFVVDENLKKGDLACVASLVEGEDDEGRRGGHGSVVIHEDGDERTVALTSDTVTIGRLADCDVVLDDKGASRKHAQLKLRDGTWTLTDLGSTNGTRLNGQTVQSRELADGDKITIGTTVIEFRRD